MNRFLIALQFLTVLPVKIRGDIKEKDFGKSLVYFPIVGLLIGLLLVLILFVSVNLPHLVSAALILTASIIVTGAMHLDGFADTCDGLYAFKTKEKSLEIMRDSHIGAVGAVGIVVLLLLKFTLLVNISEEILWKPLILMPVFARWAQVLACLAPYAREEGKAKYFIEYAGKSEIFIATLFTFALFLLLMGLNGLILFIVATMPVFLFINYIEKKIGGMTGDTIGATSEIAEVVVLLFSLILSRTNI